uniref:Uncharacterized protein n=1 Tax=Anguilla anguilla TaxID=7936 RepID=A0A0E9PJD8_ANGAN
MSHASEFTEINGHGISREPQCEVMHCRFYLGSVSMEIELLGGF